VVVCCFFFDLRSANSFNVSGVAMVGDDLGDLSLDPLNLSDAPLFFLLVGVGMGLVVRPSFLGDSEDSLKSFLLPPDEAAVPLLPPPWIVTVEVALPFVEADDPGGSNSKSKSSLKPLECL
jgi:hypothetical protein